MNTKILTLLLVLTLALAGCASGGSPSQGDSWLLDSLTLQGLAVDLSTAQPVTLVFDTETVVGGSSGCNSYFGELEFKSDGTVTAGNIGSTQMACNNGMEVESAFLGALSRVETYELSRYELTLKADNGDTVLVFQLLRGE